MAAEAESLDIGEVILHHVSDSEALIPIRIPIGSRVLDLSITKHVIMLWIAAVLVFLLYAWLARRLRAAEHGEPKGTLATMLEFFVSFIREQIVIPFIGREYAPRFLPLSLTFFTFILVNNLLGLIPGSATATGNFNVTAGLATITFGMIIYAGSIAHGFIGHWTNLVPHGLRPRIVYALLIPIEIISMFVKPFALTMRLAANMTAGHIAILAIMSFIFVFKSAIIGFAVSTPLMTGLLMLEIIVCLVQAYVFTLLSSLFIGMAIHVHH